MLFDQLFRYAEAFGFRFVGISDKAAPEHVGGPRYLGQQGGNQTAGAAFRGGDPQALGMWLGVLGVAIFAVTLPFFALVLAGYLAAARRLLPSSAICILALAILERDGLLVMGALTMIALTGGIMLELIYYAWHYAQLLWQSVF